MSTGRFSGHRRDGASGPPEAESRGITLRIREIREDVFGRSGVPNVAALVGVSDQTWAEYESGATIPAEVILRLMEEVGVTPHWLLTGRGDKYRTARWFSLPHNRN